MDAHFTKDLGLDSLDAVEIVTAFEDEFGEMFVYVPCVWSVSCKGESSPSLITRVHTTLERKCSCLWLKVLACEKGAGSWERRVVFCLSYCMIATSLYYSLTHSFTHPFISGVTIPDDEADQILSGASAVKYFETHKGKSA